MLIAVGGHSRNVGKTSVVCGIIAALPEMNWQAFKITQHGHNICSQDGHPCDCAPADATHPFAIDQQVGVDSTDTGRYLRAGARRAWWVRTAQGALGHAIPDLRGLLADAPNNIVESNSLLRFLQPDLYIVVLDYSIADMKDSFRLYMDRADAFVVQTHGLSPPPWQGIPPRWLQGKPCFDATPGETIPSQLTEFIRSRDMKKASGQKGSASSVEDPA
ncbi:MAG: hypothetical protein HY820_33725 [Acidobacteria bacterium]|nr:hypothetical protein [Acidobacteriota bacterium]